MPQMSDLPFRRVHFSRQLLRTLPSAIRKTAEDASEGRLGNEMATTRSLVVLKASEILHQASECVPDWVDAETAYLIVADIPEPALFRLPTILRVHKPDQRIHVTRDVDAVKRQAIALTRDHAIEGIVDAYVLWRDLWVVLGDMSTRCFPTGRMSFLAGLSNEQLQDFQIHSSGSYLLWQHFDLRVGASQLIQAVDPMHLADVMIEGYAAEKMSLALRLLREERGLTQADIGGLSERHVRRLEREEARLTSGAAKKYALAFGTSVSEFLAALGRSLTRLKDEPELTDSDGLTRKVDPLVRQPR
jgi:hypothetical protein